MFHVVCFIGSACVSDVQCFSKQLLQLLLIGGEVSLHDVHARAQQTLKGIHFKNYTKEGFYIYLIQWTSVQLRITEHKEIFQP